MGVPPGPETDVVMSWSPCLVRSVGPSSGELRTALGHRLVDDYLEFLAARCRPNTVLAATSDLKIFFELFPKEPAEVSTGDVLGFIAAQRGVGGGKVVRLIDGESGLSARTIQRRLSSLSSMYAFLTARGSGVPGHIASLFSGRRGWLLLGRRVAGRRRRGLR